MGGEMALMRMHSETHAVRLYGARYPRLAPFKISNFKFKIQNFRITPTPKSF
jgi:hypothetical protein